MKDTKVMLAFIATLITTAMLVAAVGYLLSDLKNYKECFQTNAFCYFMILFGWIPALVVASDLNEKLKGM